MGTYVSTPLSISATHPFDLSITTFTEYFTTPGYTS